MNTTCPHCQTEIEIDPPTLAALQERQQFQCPACNEPVPVPEAKRGPVKVTAAAVIKNTAVQKPSQKIQTKSGGINRNMTILAVAAVLFAASIVLFIRSRPDSVPPKDASVPKNIPSRPELDAKLVFEGPTSSFVKPDDDWAFGNLRPEVESNRPFPVYKELWDEKQVFAIHPIATDKPGVLDFGKITNYSKGTLTIKARNHPKGDCRLELVGADGQAIHVVDLKGNQWLPLQATFDHQQIQLKVHANGWACEYAFITYSIE